MSSPETSRQKMVAHLREVFPKAFVEALVAILRSVYADSTRSEMAKLSGSRRQFVVGVRRYAYVEEEVPKACCGLFRVRDITIEEVKGEGGAMHVEVRAGRFVLTFACTQRPDKFVKPSKYRTNLALKNQLGLFNNSDGYNPVVDYYGILLHGPIETAAGYDYSRPGFFKLAFPDSEFNGYVTDHVDLLSLYNIDLAPVVTDNTEKIPDQVRPRLKPGTPKGPKP